MLVLLSGRGTTESHCQIDFASVRYYDNSSWL